VTVRVLVGIGGVAITAMLCGCSTVIYSSRSTAPATLSSDHAAYVAQANAICAHYNAADSKLTARTTRLRVHTPLGEVRLLKGSLPEQMDVARAIDEVGLDEARALRRLSSTAADRPIVAGIYANFVESLRLADESTRLLASNPTAATRLTERAAQVMASANARATAFGMTVCAQ
jgi:hypothetical protein